jgi:hypothetical protein
LISTDEIGDVALSRRKHGFEVIEDHCRFFFAFWGLSVGQRLRQYLRRDTVLEVLCEQAADEDPAAGANTLREMNVAVAEPYR